MKQKQYALYHCQPKKVELLSCFALNLLAESLCAAFPLIFISEMIKYYLTSFIPLQCEEKSSVFVCSPTLSKTIPV
ncbi:MAG TPA: hypothetical protein GX746_03155 [Bacteroidales bacterium]|nr:hypothetical protein [Bacteroidales bacterium]